MSITVYIGCMFSGKTSRLISEYKRWKKIGKSVICINYEKDNRYGESSQRDSPDNDFMYSHNMEKAECIKTLDLSDISEDKLINYDIIMINEGQFFANLVDFCIKWCEQYNKNIIVCGLDGSFQRKPMGQINELLSVCDNIEKLKALCDICKDGTFALFSWRITPDQEQIIIGTDYIPVCRKHFIDLNNKQMFARDQVLDVT